MNTLTKNKYINQHEKLQRLATQLLELLDFLRSIGDNICLNTLYCELMKVLHNIDYNAFSEQPKSLLTVSKIESDTENVSKDETEIEPETRNETFVMISSHKITIQELKTIRDQVKNIISIMKELNMNDDLITDIINIVDELVTESMSDDSIEYADNHYDEQQFDDSDCCDGWKGIGLYCGVCYGCDINSIAEERHARTKAYK